MLGGIERSEEEPDKLFLHLGKQIFESRTRAGYYFGMKKTVPTQRFESARGLARHHRHSEIREALGVRQSSAAFPPARPLGSNIRQSPAT